LVFPAIALTILVLAINVIGDELRDMLDPENAR
jgi:ABC-type dipeptide/oligopeptide/nickel transport system permease subunit